MPSLQSDTSYHGIEYIAAKGQTNVLLTCEHASARLPPSWHWPNADKRLETEHWGVDIGIARFTREMASALNIPAVLAGTSRLLADCNRTLESNTLFRGQADGSPVWLNQGLSPKERESRIAQIYQQYHQVLSRACTEHAPQLVLSMHSYTPSYEGSPRSVQIGVLHDGEPELAETWKGTLQKSLNDYDVRVNEPWSGIGGYMYSAVMHAEECGATAMELEIRNDLLVPNNTPMLLKAMRELLSQHLSI
jgi:predicted N-formylglutamate amidohydrolase